ncbi:MAG: cell division protein SepF [Acutalibacteraceae bacterium]|nr:cell division protein SepF [Acutalibacteraceae bacterium]
MAKFTDKLKNLWNVPEELEEDEYEHSHRNSRDEEYASSRRSKRNDEYEFSRRRDYDDELSSRRSRYVEDEYEYDYSDNDSYNEDYDEDYNNNYDENRSYSDEYGRNNIDSKNKVLNIAATARLEVVFFKPESFIRDADNIAKELMKSHTVLLNFEETPRDESKRIVDFVSGCAYVSNGKVQRIAQNIFIITPNSVELKGDSLIDELASNGLKIVE